MTIVENMRNLFLNIQHVCIQSKQCKSVLNLELAIKPRLSQDAKEWHGKSFFTTMNGKKQTFS